MSFSFFKSKSKAVEGKNRFEDQTLKLSKEDVLKIREELKRYDEEQRRLKDEENPNTRQGKKTEKLKERSRSLNVAIVIVILLLILVFYAVSHW